MSGCKYKCEVCKFECERPAHLRRHISSTKHKSNVYDKMCGDNFASKSNDNEVIQKLELQEQRAMIYILQERIANLEQKMNENGIVTNHNITNNNVTNHNVTNTINISLSPHEFGREDWSYISDNEILQIMSGVNTCIPNIVQRLHFDIKHPENHNIKIQNKSRPEIKIFDGEMWITQDKNTTIDFLINNIRGRLDDYEEKFLEKTSSVRHSLWTEYWQDMNEDKRKQKEVRNKIIGTIQDCQEIFNTDDILDKKND